MRTDIGLNELLGRRANTSNLQSPSNGKRSIDFWVGTFGNVCCNVLTRELHAIRHLKRIDSVGQLLGRKLPAGEEPAKCSEHSTVHQQVRVLGDSYWSDATLKFEPMGMYRELYGNLRRIFSGRYLARL